MTYLPPTIQKKLAEVDGDLCAYCQTSIHNTGQPLTIDHIQPRSLEGSSTYQNLCLACRRCNEFKGNKVKAIDPLTGQNIPLFHPRRDTWSEHFKWDATGTRLRGITQIGRATIVALNINNEVIVNARYRWVSVGWHPPSTFT